MFIFFLIALSFGSSDQELRECVINCARNQIGKDYVLGTQGPDTFDCSGLVCYCYAECGMGFTTRELTYDLIYEGVEVTYEELTLADLVFPSIEHVQIYSGNGNIIHAPRPGSYVQEVEIYSFWRARRIVTDGMSIDPNVAPSSGSCIVLYDGMNVRVSPSTSSESVATYNAGDIIFYDSIVDGDGRKWISYIGGSGSRRYICGRNSDGTCYTKPCPAA